MGKILDLFGASQAAKATTKAAQQSAAASQYATDQSTALQKEQFDRIWGATQTGRDAGNAATARLSQWSGLTPMGQDWNAYLEANPDVKASVSAGGFGGEGGLSGAAQRHYLEYGQTEGRTAPGQQTITSQLRETPGYQFNFTEGQNALETSLAKRGMGQSGAAAKAAIEYGQNYGDRIFNQERNALMGIAGLGQNATNTGAQTGQATTNATQNALTGNAQNLSSSYKDIADAKSGFWGTVSGLWGENAMARTGAQFAKMYAGGGF